ncbi:MAG TPA: cytochrome c [Solirubrobacteraceae bacterium]|nr:cytochrome c [Solirubrobacteraceae bacterium]
MRRRAKIAACVAAVLAGAVVLAACSNQRIKLSSSDPYYHGAVLFADHCSGCHSLSLVSAQGSATKVRDRERTNGPNFNVRKEQVPQILYAIRNGGFSGAIMPQNVVVGADAQAVAEFLARYSGLKATSAGGSSATGQPQSGLGGNP